MQVYFYIFTLKRRRYGAEKDSDNKTNCHKRSARKAQTQEAKTAATKRKAQEHFCHRRGIKKEYGTEEKQKQPICRRNGGDFYGE